MRVTSSYIHVELMTLWCHWTPRGLHISAGTCRSCMICGLLYFFSAFCSLTYWNRGFMRGRCWGWAGCNSSIIGLAHCTCVEIESNVQFIASSFVIWPTQKTKHFLQEVTLLLRCNWDFCCSGLLCSVRSQKRDKLSIFLALEMCHYFCYESKNICV